MPLLTQEDLEELLYSIEQKKCTPIIGPSANTFSFPFDNLAHKWADEYNYPLEDSDQLSQVAEFMALSKGDEIFPKKLLSRELKKISPHDFSKEEYRNTPYAALADLNLPIYITTNYDTFMEAAIKSRGRNPISEFCRWNTYGDKAETPSVLDDPSYKPTEDKPLVYHLLGHLEYPKSMVLTEHDYYDFVATLYKGNEFEILSYPIMKSLATNLLLFFGYSLQDITFRIVFRGLMNLLAVKPYFQRIAVLHPPDLQTGMDPDEALIYLDAYTKNLINTHTYWGDPQNFAKWLREPSKTQLIMNFNKIDQAGYTTKGFKRIEAGKILTGSALLYRMMDYYENSHAVIIGLGKYMEESNIQTLPNALNDAQGIRNVLERSYGFRILDFLFDAFATRDNIREVIIDKIKDESEIRPKDRVIIYYSGHGKLKTRIGHNGEEIREGYIIPYDAKLNKYSSYISMDEIVKACQNCPAKHVLLILDCCYSGYAARRSIGLEKPNRATSSFITNLTSRRALQVLAAGEEDQPVNDSGVRPGFSAFTGALLDLLESGIDLDNDGILTCREIGLSLRAEVAKQTTTGNLQVPVYRDISGSEDGDLVFMVYN